jgi:hypothetical protein
MLSSIIFKQLFKKIRLVLTVRSLGHFQAFCVFYFLLPVFEYDTVKTEVKPHAKTVQKFVLELTQI